MTKMKSFKIEFEVGPLKGETRFVMPSPGTDGIVQRPYSRKTSANQTSPRLKAWQAEVRGAFVLKDLPPELPIDSTLASILATLKGTPKVKYVRRGGKTPRYNAIRSEETYAGTINTYFGGGSEGYVLKGRAVAMLFRMLHSALRNPFLDEGTKSSIRSFLAGHGVTVAAAAPTGRGRRK